MDEEARDKPKDSRVKAVLRKAAGYFMEKMSEPENGCGKCAVCHRVCNLLDKKQGPREE